MNTSHRRRSLWIGIWAVLMSPAALHAQTPSRDARMNACVHRTSASVRYVLAAELCKRDETLAEADTRFAKLSVLEV